MIDRERKIDVEKLTPEQAQELSVKIGEKIKEINDKTVAEINRFLIIYGMEAKTQIIIGKLGEFGEKAQESLEPEKKQTNKSKKKLKTS